MTRLPTPQTVERGTQGVEPGPNAKPALPRSAVADRLAADAATAGPGRKTFARGAVIGLAIVIPFWLAVAVILLWVL